MSPRCIFFDEAGFTGPNLLDPEQPFFTYAGVDLTALEAERIVASIRAKYRVQSPELKSSVLRQRGNWPDIALDIARQSTGRALVTASDKILALCGKVFEYIYEPVIEDKSTFFYGLNVHRFFMNAFYAVLQEADAPIDVLAGELQQFMRSFDPSKAPTLFEAVNKEGHRIEIVDITLRFARGYSQQIESRTKHLREGGSGKWALDLTSTSLFNLLFLGFGARYQTIEVICDESKPLKSVAEFFDTFVGRADAASITDGRDEHVLQGNLTKPIAFASSAAHPSLQIADILAGATASTLKDRNNAAYDSLREWINQHMHWSYILPNPELIDTGREGPKVALEILRVLANRADRGQDPLAGIP